MECRKRVVAGKVTPLEGAGSDLACLPVETAAFAGEIGVAAAMVPPCLSGRACIESRGARAPPLNFA